MTSPANGRATFPVLMLVIVAVNLPQSVVVPVLPRLQADYGTSQVSATWLITGFLLSSGVAIPILGRLGDAHGRRRVLTLALLTLAAGSVASALAPTIGWAILARFVQGVGGGAVPVAFSALRDALPLARLRYGAAVLGTVGSIAFSGGIVAAGPLLDGLGRPALFGMCCLVALAAAIGVHLAVPDSSEAAPEGRFGVLPVLLFSSGLVALLLAISQSSAHGWTSPLVLGLVIATAVLSPAWAVAERRATVPFIDLDMLRLRGMWTSNLVAFLAGIGLFGSAAALPQLIQIPRSAGYGVDAGLDAVGLLMMPIALTAFLTSLCTGALYRVLSARVVLVLGACLSAASFAGFAWWHDGRGWIVGWCALQGVGNGLILATLASVVVVSVPPSQTGVANGMNNNLRTLGGSLGAAVTAAVLAAHTHRANGGGPVIRETGFLVVFAMMAVAMVIAGLAALLVPETGSGRRQRGGSYRSGVPLRTLSTADPRSSASRVRARSSRRA
jgi:MFS family permease